MRLEVPIRFVIGLPNPGHVWFAADEKVPVHTVYTPYKVVEKENSYYIADPSGIEDKNDLLYFEIEDAQNTGKIDDLYGATIYEATLRTKWQNKTIKENTVVTFRHEDNRLGRQPVQDKEQAKGSEQGENDFDQQQDGDGDKNLPYEAKTEGDRDGNLSDNDLDQQQGGDGQLSLEANAELDDAFADLLGTQ